ncbi:hypothetical protein [Nocardioides sp. LHG3406-4]|uniref:hypothetical protein n=1 Tax=Nocardioides sp. LHG3406-4 TaxID=2804575 RepID=UPI003CF9CBF3
MSTDPLLAIADELYALGVAEFTAARDARVKELKASDKELSARVKLLRKPSVAAWAVNLFVRREAEQVEQVIAVGAALREAQANLDGDELRALTRQRRQLTAAVSSRVRACAADERQRLSDSVVEQVEATLTAAMLDEGAAAAVRSGMLTASLAATGVEAVDVAAVVAAPGALGFTASVRQADDEPPAARPELHVVPDPEADQKRRKAAQEKLDAAEAGVAEAQEAYDTAAVEVGELEARSMQVQAQIDELRRQIAEHEATAEEVDDELSDAEDVRAEAEETLAAAIRDREAAAAALAKLD